MLNKKKAKEKEHLYLKIIFKDGKLKIKQKINYQVLFEFL
jgi:hypothetical protein